jgi:hypothetical protein
MYVIYYVENNQQNALDSVLLYFLRWLENARYKNKKLYIIYLYITVNEGFHHRAIITCLLPRNKIAGITKLGGCYCMMADTTAYEFLYERKGKLNAKCEK